MEAELNITELISVETGLLTVTVKGTASHPSFPGVVYAGKEAVYFGLKDQSSRSIRPPVTVK